MQRQAMLRQVSGGVAMPPAEVLGVVGVVVLYNNLMALLPGELHKTIYVPVNLLFLGLVLLWVVRRLGLGWEELGLKLRPLWPRLRLGVLLGVALPAPLFLLPLFPGVAEQGEGVPQLEGQASLLGLAYLAAVRIPLGTALFEEVLFRGVVYGLALRWSGRHRRAVVWSVVAFGLWHVVVTGKTFWGWEAVGGSWIVWPVMAGGVLVTALGGLVFAWLRYRTGSVAGCVAMHGLLNSLALVAVYLAV